jgi:hypothetical protein
MKYFAIVNPGTLEIHGTYMAEASLYDGMPDSWPHLELAPDMEDRAIQCVRKEVEVPVGDYGTVQVREELVLERDTEKEAQLFQGRMKIVRKERNVRLAECDWVVLPDVVMSAELKDKWVAYRQALRDLPGSVTDPKDVAWPSPPE